jgi:uncharacterized membrane protein required for colicin V production
LEGIEPFDLVMFLALLAMFIVGYAQGIVRRLLGIAAILFSLVLAAQLRAPLGDYLAKEWTTSTAGYAHMVAFGAIFAAAAITISVGIQLSYRPAPIIDRYPVLDEILGGVLGVIEGVIIFVAIVMILDPYFRPAGTPSFAGEFGPLRSLHDLIDDSLSADIARQRIIPGILAVFGFLFPRDVVATFATVLSARA